MCQRQIGLKLADAPQDLGEFESDIVSEVGGFKQQGFPLWVCVRGMRLRCVCAAGRSLNFDDAFWALCEPYAI